MRERLNWESPRHTEIAPRTHFTPREVEFLQHLTDGIRGYQNIALQMGIASATVDNHAQNIRTVLQNRNEKYPNLRRALVIAIDEDLIDTTCLPRLDPKNIKPKDAEVLALLLTGYPIAEISEKMGVGRNTTENRISRVLQKTNAHSGYQALAMCAVLLKENGKKRA